MAIETTEDTGLFCRIQVRLDGASWEALSAYREQTGLSISAAIRLLCQQAGEEFFLKGSVGGRPVGGRRLREVYMPEDRFALSVNGRERKRPFINFFRGTRDIGVLLDLPSWTGLSVFMQRYGLSVSEAVRLLCLRTQKQLIIATGGPRQHRY